MQRAQGNKNEQEFAVNMISQLHKCVFFLEELLKSAESSDVVEAITTLKLMRNFDIGPAKDGMATALQLVTQPTQKPEVAKTVMDMFEDTYTVNVCCVLKYSQIVHSGRICCSSEVLILNL